MSAVIEYSSNFADSLIAQGKGSNFLVLSKLDQPTSLRADGKKAQFELVYRWLSQDCERENDEAYACTQGSEVTYWQRKELKSGFFDRLKAGTINLFDEFSLF